MLWKTPVKLRLSHFIFKKNHSQQSGQAQRLTAVPHNESSLSCKKHFLHFLCRLAGVFVNKNLLCMFLLHKCIAVSQSDLKDRNLLKLWMNSNKLEYYYLRENGNPNVECIFESDWSPRNSVFYFYVFKLRPSDMNLFVPPGLLGLLQFSCKNDSATLIAYLLGTRHYGRPWAKKNQK